MQTDISNKIKLYILCHTSERLTEAHTIYGQYQWAIPILMKYQDATFENAFWQQLLEIKAEWIDCAMVGALSFRAHAKINLRNMDSILRSGVWKDKHYIHFVQRRYPAERDGHCHPHFLTIWNDMLRTLRLKTTNANHYNYWMCRPAAMLAFIEWFHTECQPAILAHPLAFTDSKYKGNMTPDALMKLCGVPHYPHVPFVLERLNKCFFDRYIANGGQNMTR